MTQTLNYLPRHTTISPKVFYLLVFFAAVVLAMVIKVFGNTLLKDLPITVANVWASQQCVGNQAVLRVSFALVLFFLTTLVVSVMTIFNGKYMILQVLYLIVLFILSFLLSNDFYNTYSSIARFISGLFLMIQLIDLIDLMYKCNDRWVEKDDKRYYAAILMLSAVFLIGSIAAWGFFFVMFAAGPDCDLERFFIVFTIIPRVGFTAFSISDWAAKGALLPSAALTAYSTFLLSSALRNDPAAQCNGGSATNHDFWQIGIGMVVTAGAVTFSGWSVSTGTVFVDTELENLKSKADKLQEI